MSLYFLRKLWAEFILGKHVSYFDIGDIQGVGLGSAQDREHARSDPALGPRFPKKMLDPPTQHPPIVEILKHVKITISSLNHSLVKHSRFVALSGKEVLEVDIDRGVGGSTCTTYYSEERAHGHRNHPCKPHKSSSCRNTCYRPIEPNGKHRFMEEVSIITLFMLFIVIYLFCIMCIYIDILLYVVLYFLHPSSRLSTLMDASTPSPTT
jgi:hypothetical protein